jgi:hypothetical protein
MDGEADAAMGPSAGGVPGTELFLGIQIVFILLRL